MIKRLMKCVREYKKPSLLAPLTISMEVIIEIIIPYLMADLIDYGINQNNMPYIIKMGLFLLLCTFCSLSFGALAGRFAAVASAGFAKRCSLFSFLKIPMKNLLNISDNQHCRY